MTVEVHVVWAGDTCLVGRLYTPPHGPVVSFEYVPEWLGRTGAFSIDPTSLPLRPGAHHAPALFGAIQDCGPDRWGRMLIGRALRKQVLDRKPYQDLDYVLALDDSSRIGALRFRSEPDGSFLSAGDGRIPPIVQLAALLNAADAVHSETESAEDLRFLLGQALLSAVPVPNPRSVFPTAGWPSRSFRNPTTPAISPLAKSSRSPSRSSQASTLPSTGSWG